MASMKYAIVSLVVSMSAAVSLAACSGNSVHDAPTDAGSPDAADAPPLAPQTLSITETAMFQVVKVPLSKDGAKVDDRLAPVVAGRDGLLRVYYRPDAGWKRHGVVGELTITSPGMPTPLVLKTVQDVTGSYSRDSDLKTTFNFEVPADAVRVDSRYSVVLRLADKSVEYARHPSEGAPELLDAASSGEQLKVKIVPVRYDADGTGRVPDVTPDAVEAYRAAMFAMYPTKKVEITVRDTPFVWSTPITADGTGWSELLQDIVQLRSTDRVPEDVYYYGLFAPAASIWKYCGKTVCIVGLSNLTGPSDVVTRVSIGVGYGDDQSAETMVHEIGHAHGRQHSPCGDVLFPDKKYPYPGGIIGSVGYDVGPKALVDSESYDVMSYCDPKWISDYTYGKIFQRMQLVNSAKAIYSPGGPQTFRFVGVSKDGKLTWGKTITVSSPLFAEPHAVTFEGPDGKSTTVTGHYFPYEDLAGGYILVPEPTTTVLRVHVAGLPAAVQSVLERRAP